MIAPVGGQPSQVDPMMVVYKEFDITVLCCCNLCCSCCAPKNTVHTHDTYMVEKLVIPNSCGKCCGDTKYTSAAMYDKLDHLILTRDCTCLSSCPECCFQYGCCPCAQSKMQLGWRNGLAFSGMEGAAYNFIIGTGSGVAKEIHDIVDLRIRNAKKPGSGLTESAENPLSATGQSNLVDLSYCKLEVFANCLKQTQTTCCCCERAQTTMFESMKLVTHFSCCFGCCPGEFKAFNQYGEDIHGYKDPMCGGDKLSANTFTELSKKLGEDASKLAQRTRGAPQPDKEYLLTSCCWIKDNRCCPKESFTLKQDVIEWNATQCCTPLEDFCSPGVHSFLKCISCPCCWWAQMCGCWSLMCAQPCPNCRVHKAVYPYAAIDQLEMRTESCPCCCKCGEGFFVVKNAHYGALSTAIIPGVCLGCCCGSGDVQAAYHDILRRASGSAERWEGNTMINTQIVSSPVAVEQAAQPVVVQQG